GGERRGGRNWSAGGGWRVSVLSSISGIEKPAAASDPSTKVKCVAGEVRFGKLGREWRLDQWRIVAITGRPRLGLLSVSTTARSRKSNVSRTAAHEPAQVALGALE